MQPTELNRPIRSGSRRAPAEQIQAQPWSFMGLAFVLGLTAGLLFRVRTVRKGLRLYLLARRFV